MESALSLKTGFISFAKDVNYDAYKRLLLICPECKEPVHLRKKITTTNTSYFAHSEYKGKKEGDVCSLRVLSYWDQPHVNLGMWASKGQLIENIQIELISYFSEQFGVDKNIIIKYIKLMINEYSSCEWIYTDLIDNLSEAKQSEI